MHDKMAVSGEVYHRDFRGLAAKDILYHLTVDAVFEWKKGSLFAADRFKYHSSCNYINQGVTYKKAIVCWTGME